MKPRTVTVTISGPQGSGKTQLAHAIANLLRSNGISVTLHDDGGLRTVEKQELMKSFPKTSDVSVEVEQA